MGRKIRPLEERLSEFDRKIQHHKDSIESLKRKKERSINFYERVYGKTKIKDFIDFIKAKDISIDEIISLMEEETE